MTLAKRNAVYCYFSAFRNMCSVAVFVIINIITIFVLFIRNIVFENLTGTQLVTKFTTVYRKESITLLEIAHLYPLR
jgi:hypothetical protein